MQLEPEDDPEIAKHERPRHYRRPCAASCCDDVTDCASGVTCCLGRQLLIVSVVALIIIALVVAVIYLGLRQTGASSTEATQMIQEMMTTAISRISKTVSSSTAGGGPPTRHWHFTTLTSPWDDVSKCFAGTVTATAGATITFNMTIGRNIGSPAKIVFLAVPMGDPDRVVATRLTDLTGPWVVPCTADSVACRLLTGEMVAAYMGLGIFQGDGTQLDAAHEIALARLV